MLEDDKNMTDPAFLAAAASAAGKSRLHGNPRHVKGQGRAAR